MFFQDIKIYEENLGNNKNELYASLKKLRDIIMQIEILGIDTSKAHRRNSRNYNSRDMGGVAIEPLPDWAYGHSGQCWMKQRPVNI